MAPSPSAPESQSPLLAVLARFWLLGVIAIVLLAAAGFWFKSAFHDRGYAPVQPIAFSHKQHAGDLKLDCRYCHFNAERGKHAGVPPMETCLGCHGAGRGGIAAERPSIQKLQEIADQGSYIDESTGVVSEGGVVHWARVHKLPDHVYFNHGAHDRAGVACQTCHGPVESMVRLRQFSTLTMAWCLDCHRRSNYVGGPQWKRSDPASFAVGTASYQVMLDRQLPDPEVEFHPRRLAGRDEAVTATAAATGPAEADQRVQRKLARLFAAKPELAKALADAPAWRQADHPDTILQTLPDSHRPFYGTAEALVNAPTQCSTCHQ